jgi:hypothetical protein
MADNILAVLLKYVFREIFTTTVVKRHIGKMGKIMTKSWTNKRDK